VESSRPWRAAWTPLRTTDSHIKLPHSWDLTTSNGPASDPVTEPAQPARAAAPSLGRLARRLTAVNVLITLTSVVASPLQARALGPAGRGDLAAVTVVGTLVSGLGDFGLSQFVLRETAKGTAVRKLIGSIGPLIVLIGLCWAAAGPAIAGLIAGNRQTVYWLLLVLLIAMPLQLVTTSTNAMLWGQQRWRLFTMMRLAVPVGTTIVYGILFVVGDLTVESAGITFLLLGVVVSSLPGLVPLRGAGRPEWSSALARAGGTYGIKMWFAGMANQTNARLDQVLMTRLVSPSQLGLYVVAVNISLMQIGITAAVATALFPRVVSGDADLAARALRVMVALITLISVGLILVVPVLLPLVFGARFSDAVVMCQILLVAAVPFGAAQIMTNVLAGFGHPGPVARAELLSVCITMPALLVFVRRYGGVGAAVISVIAYSSTAIYMAIQLRPLLGLSWTSMFIMRRADLKALKALPVVGRFVR
jgi:O-antigen/teichoic acid export membrane protein